MARHFIFFWGRLRLHIEGDGWSSLSLGVIGRFEDVAPAPTGVPFQKANGVSAFAGTTEVVREERRKRGNDGKGASLVRVLRRICLCTLATRYCTCFA